MINKAIQYGDRSVSVLHIHDKPWFRGKDVAAILEYTDCKQALQLHVPPKYKQNYGQFCIAISGWSGTPKLSFEEDSRTVYISEAGLTRLVMKSQKAAAVAFQDWVTDELLPSLRVQRMNEISEWKAYYEKCLEQQKTSITNLINLYDSMDVMHKLYGEKEYIYIVGTYQYCVNGIFKVGRTKNIRHRIAQYNTGRVECDKVLVLNTFEVYDAMHVEKQIHTTLRSIRYKNTAELYRCPYKFLVELIQNIVEDNENNYEHVKQLISFINGLNRAEDCIWSDEIENEEFLEIHRKLKAIKPPPPEPEEKEAPQPPQVVIHNVEQLQLYVQQQSGGELRWCELIKHISKRMKLPRKQLRDLVQKWCSDHHIQYHYR